MKASLSIVLAAVALPSMLLVGCGGGGGVKKGGDMAMKSTADMTMMDNCTQITSWPGTTTQGNVGAFFTPDDQGSTVDDSIIQAFDPTANAEGNFNILFAEVDITHGTAETYPATVMFNGMTSFAQGGSPSFGKTGSAISFMLANYDVSMQSNGGGADVELYIAQGGSLTMNSVSDSPSGSMSVSATSLHLVQFTNTQTPTLVPNGKCYDVASFSAMGAYIASPDGGADM